MTIQELSKTIYLNTGPHSAAPSINMTDAQWQEKFSLMKQMVRPSADHQITNSHSQEPFYWNEDLQDSYDGITNWQSYSLFINDSLRQLRRGEICYAWFTYQIRDLLRFEHDRLRTRYTPQDRMWVLWLEWAPPARHPDRAAAHRSARW